jgi:hypothetical protein
MKHSTGAQRARPVDDALPARRIRPGHPLILVSLRCGRLANRLVLFANFIAFAEEYGCRLANVTFHSYAHLYETTRRDLYCRYPIAARVSLWDRLPFVPQAIRRTRLFYHAVRGGSVLNERLPLLAPRVVTLRTIRGQPVTLLDSPEILDRIGKASFVFAYGWLFRAPDCLRQHAEIVRRYLRPISRVERAAVQALAPLRAQADVVVGVHLRHGDYRAWKKGRYFFPVAVYARWMRSLVDQFAGQKVAFLVCSDEPRTAGEFPGLTAGFGAGTAVADLHSLAACDYILGPPSTFSQWASFYGKRPLLHMRQADSLPRLPDFCVSNLLEIP